jgi:endonuclease/exonuclease/phosphatase family metal-dependent hydrolase
LIVGGDFNHHIAKIHPKMTQFGLIGIVPKGSTTHLKKKTDQKGNLLDQIFTNGKSSQFAITAPKLDDGTNLSDHQTVQATIMFENTTFYKPKL